MKVGILIDRLNVGGVEKIAIEEVRALIEAGVDAELVIMRKKAVIDNAFLDLRKNLPITYLDERMPAIFRLSFGFPLFYFFSLFHLTYPLLLPFFVKKREYDYLIVHGTYTSLTAIQLKRRRDIPFSGFIWDPASYLMERVYQDQLPHAVFTFLRFLAHRVDSYLINAMNSVLVGGTAHNAFITSIAPNKRIDVVYPSVHMASKLLQKESYVFVITAWKEGKHPEYLIELAKALPNIHFKMGGKWIDQSYRDRFEGQLRQNNLTESIEVLGGVDEKELSSLYGHALVVLQTNDDRGFGMPALEAASQGSCFIIPKDQGVCDLFEEGVHGYYTNEKDTEMITYLLRNLFADTKSATIMGKAAWNHVRNRYSWKDHAELLLGVVRSNTNV